MARLERFCAVLVLGAAATMGSWAQATTGGGHDAVPGQEVTPAKPQEPPKDARAAQPKAPRGALRESAVVRVIPIKHCNADDLARVLQVVDDALGDLRIATEMSTNSLVVAGDEKTLAAKIMPLLEALDRPLQAPAAPAAEATISIHLQHADAPTVVKALYQLSGESGGSPNRRPSVRLVGDTRTNTVLLVGAADRVKQYETWARELDTSESPPKISQRELRYYTLKSADARMLGKTVSQTLGAMSLDVPIISDIATDTLIAIGTKDDHDLVSGIIAKLDVPAKNRAVPAETAPEPKAETGTAPKKP